MTIELANQGNDAVEDIWFGVADQLEEDAGRFLEGMRPQFFTDGDIETYYDRMISLKIQSLFLETKLVWFGFALFFLWPPFLTSRRFSRAAPQSHLKNERYGSVVHLKESLDVGESKQFGFQLYTGPKELDRLESLSEDPPMPLILAFSCLLSLGFFSFAEDFLYAGFANWGVSILLLTLFRKTHLLSHDSKRLY